MVESPGAIKAEGSAHVQVVRLEISDRTLSTTAIAISALAIGLAILAVILGQISEREARLAQQDAMLLKAALVAHGISYEEDQLHKEDK